VKTFHYWRELTNRPGWLKPIVLEAEDSQQKKVPCKEGKKHRAGQIHG